MKMRKIAFVPFLSMLLQSLPVHADGGVEFVPVPVDVDKNCSAIILKGTQRFKGIGFVTPKIFLSENKNRERLFEIIPVDGGEYLIRMGLYIPLDSSKSGPTRTDTGLYTPTCDFDQIRIALAKQTKKNGEPILTLAPLPIRKLEVRIDGIKEPFVVGTANTDLLDYLGMDEVVEFRVNQSKLKEIISRLNGGFGLGVTVAMSFKARSTAGYIKIKIDQKKFELALEAALKNRETVPYQDLSATVKTVLDNINADIYQEGDDAVMNQLVGQIMGQFVGNHPEAISKSSFRPESDDYEPIHRRSFERDDVIRNDALIPRDSTGKNPLPPIPVEPTKSEEDPSVGVKAFLSFVKSEMNMNLQYQKMGVEEDKNIMTSTIIRADVQELSSRVHRVGTQEGKTSLSYFLKKGNEITFTVNGITTEKLTSLEVVKEQPLTREELAPLYGTLSPLPKFSSLSRMNIASLESDPINGAVLTEYPNFFMRAFNFALSAQMGIPNFMTGVTLTKWTRVIRTPVYDIKAPEVPIEMTEATMYALPFKFTFAKIGSRRFTMRDLFEKNPYFETTYDSFGQKITLKALQPLGLITVFNEERTPKKKVMLNYYIETSHKIMSKGNQVSFAGGEKVSIPAYHRQYSIRVDQEGSNSFEVKPIPSTPNEMSHSMLIVPQL